jgi:hypothetical protein
MRHEVGRLAPLGDTIRLTDHLHGQRRLSV